MRRGGAVGRLENFTLREDKHVAMSRHMQGSELDYFMVENLPSSASSDHKKKKKLTCPVTSLVIRCPCKAGCPHKNPGRFMTPDYCVYNQRVTQSGNCVYHKRAAVSQANLNTGRA